MYLTDKLKRFLAELASFLTTCSLPWLMLLSNCHNSLYKGENLLEYWASRLIISWGRFAGSPHLAWNLFSFGRLNQSLHWARRGLYALWENFKVGHFEGLAIERGLGKSAQRGLKCFFARIFYLTSTFKSWQWHCRAETLILKVAAIAQKAVWHWKVTDRQLRLASLLVIFTKEIVFLFVNI